MSKESSTFASLVRGEYTHQAENEDRARQERVLAFAERFRALSNKQVADRLRVVTGTLEVLALRIVAAERLEGLTSE